MNDYLKVKDYGRLLGRRAIIIPKLSYCSFLYGCKGTISEANGMVLLKFDKPAIRHDEDNMPMKSVYLEQGSYELIK